MCTVLKYINPKEIARRMNEATPEEIMLAMGRLPAGALEWAVDFEIRKTVLLTGPEGSVAK